MARIAEDLLLLLLDNPAAQPSIDRSRLTRVLAAALILDLAYDCRVRPALPEDPVPPGLLVALAGPVPVDPAVRPTLAMLTQGPVTPAAATRLRAVPDVVPVARPLLAPLKRPAARLAHLRRKTVLYARCHFATTPTILA